MSEEIKEGDYLSYFLKYYSYFSWDELRKSLQLSMCYL